MKLKFSKNNGASLVAQRLKHLPAMRENWVQSLGWEDPLEKEMATHSSILAWRIPCTEEPARLQSMGKHGRNKPSNARKCAVCWVFHQLGFSPDHTVAPALDQLLLSLNFSCILVSFSLIF